MDGDRRAAGATEIATLDIDAIAAAITESAGMDVRKLKPAELIRLLNSTALGECLSRQKLQRHRDRAGSRVGDDRTVDLLRYSNWLCTNRHRTKAVDAYEAHRQRASERQREQSVASRDIGELPAVKNPERRESCRNNFQMFCEKYFATTFPLAWSPDHLTVIRRMEQVVTRGEKFALAMPRGSGKTAMSSVACVWVLVYGHRSFVAIIGPEEDHAKRMIESLKSDFEHNDLLAADFPEICYPIRRLEGIPQRRLIYHGDVIRMQFTSTKVILPNLLTAKYIGSCVEATSLTGQVRGMHYKRDDGSVIRPDLVILDDPQKDELARSPLQVDKLERIIRGAVMGLAGPGKSIAAIMPCTVVCKGDLADRMLNREKNPQWNGERMKLIYGFPVAEKLWDQYTTIRREQGAKAATAFYAARREKMDLGAHVAWEQRFEPDELSAVQHAMNLRIDRGEQAFASEYQNDPLPDFLTDSEQLVAEELLERVSGVARGVVPDSATKLTMFIDVQKKVLFYCIVAWDEDFTGQVIDYGMWPAQRGRTTSLKDVRTTLAAAYPKAGLEGAIYRGLEELAARTLGASWKAEDGSARQIDRCLIDAQWGESTETVRKFCRQSDYARVLYPSHGKAFGPTMTPLSEYRRKPGERMGPNWVVGPGRGLARQRRVLYDSNAWKSFTQSRLLAVVGDPGAMQFFGRRHHVDHVAFVSHLTSEFPTWLSGRGREMYQWELRPNRENHWWDCLVGCAVAASIEGVELESPGSRKPEPRRRESRPIVYSW